MKKVVPVTLCSGSGTGLWPLSRASFPKQFLVLSGVNSLFQQAVERANGLAAADIAIGETIVVTNEEHRFLALDQPRDIKDVAATLGENESIVILLDEIHRLANPGTIPLEIIKVQSGSSLGQDDILRFEDGYGRTSQ